MVITPSSYKKVSLVWRYLRNVVFFQAPSIDVDGNNEGLVEEHASFSCSAPGCKYISQWKANIMFVGMKNSISILMRRVKLT